MYRRTLLCASAVGATGLLAGCLDGEEPSERTGTSGNDESTPRTDEASPTTTDDGSAGEGTATDSPTDGGAETPTETDDDTPTGAAEATETPDGSGSNEMVDRTFEVVGTQCGRGANRADVSRGDDRVDVDGTIGGRNGCYTADRERATYDDGTDELTVAVRSYDDSDGGYCQQCIVDVDYRAAFEFEDGTPGTVRVLHDGEQVTTA